MKVKLDGRLIWVTELLSGTDSSLNNSVCKRVDLPASSGAMAHKVPAHGGQVGSARPLQPPRHGQLGGVHDCVSVRACELPSRKLAGLCLFR